MLALSARATAQESPAAAYAAVQADTAAVEGVLSGALVTGVPRVPPAWTATLRALPEPAQESVVRGFVRAALLIEAAPSFAEGYARERRDAYGLEPSRGDLLVPALPREMLGWRLRSFLAETADVDFSAETRQVGDLRYFVKDEYESKPPSWKLCFRSGPRLTGLTRDAAAAWLAATPGASGPTADAQDHLRRALTAFRERRWTDARDSARAAAEADPRAALAWALLARAEERLGDAEAAGDAYEKALPLAPSGAAAALLHRRLAGLEDSAAEKGGPP